MPDIRYICLSDTHLGAGTSLLTRLDEDGRADPSRPSETLVHLAACLRLLVENNEGLEKPSLVLNGDVLELARATIGVAARSLQHALELLLPAGEPPFISRVAYLPGAHDRRVWQDARERRHRAEVLRSPPGGPPPNVPHATPLFEAAPMRSALLDAVMAGLGPSRSVPVDVLYPNLALLSDDGRRLVVVQHGHLLARAPALRDEHGPGAEPGADEWQGLVEYVTGPLRDQVLAELGEMPPSVAFVYGYTHRALVSQLALPGFAQPLQVFNTGGWVVDPQRTQPLNGASVLLVDEALEVVCIQLYVESDFPGNCQVSVSGLPGPDGQPGPFQRRVAELVRRSPARWRTFSRAAGSAVAERRALLDAGRRGVGAVQLVE